MELSSSMIKKFLMFLEMELSSHKFLLYFRRELSEHKIKKNKTAFKGFLYFGKWNFLAPSLKSFLYFRGELAKAWKSKISHYLLVEREILKHKRKRKKFLVRSLIKKQNFLN